MNYANLFRSRWHDDVTLKGFWSEILFSAEFNDLHRDVDDFHLHISFFFKRLVFSYAYKFCASCLNSIILMKIFKANVLLHRKLLGENKAKFSQESSGFQQITQ